MNAVTERPGATLPSPGAPFSGRRPRRRSIDGAGAAVGLGLAGTVALAVVSEPSGALSARGGVATFAGELAGLTGTFLLLVMVLLIARIPFVERTVGQDRLLRWHRLLGQWPIYLIGAHAVLITIGYAQQARTGPWHQFAILVGQYPDVLAATVAFGLLVLAGLTSIRAARRRMRYETWWAIHLYTYLALALAFSHQLANGAAFVGHPLARVVWSILWAATAGTVLVFRVALPLVRSAWHGLRVVGVHEEAPGVVSVVCSGRHVERLGVAGGQFFQWRFLAPGLWWQAHPYSLSAMPQRGHLRVTVKALGDHSSKLSRLPLGTRVAVEGPYGAFTRRARSTDKMLLVGAGVGLTPVRALLEDLDQAVDVVVLSRASTPELLLFQGEVRTLVQRRGGRLYELVGPRTQHPLDYRQLGEMIPDIAERDVYVCGPELLNQTVVGAARRLGVPDERIHCEQFEF